MRKQLTGERRESYENKRRLGHKENNDVSKLTRTNDIATLFW